MKQHGADEMAQRLFTIIIASLYRTFSATAVAR
jgi:hypothetical protein